MAKLPIRKPLVGKAPLGSLPTKPGRSAASSLPDFIPFATCLLVDRPPNGPDWVHEVKLDGWRVQVRVEDGTATIRTRNGHDYTTTFPEIAKAARGFDNCIIDGEICAVGKDGLTDFSALQAAMKGGRTDKLILFAFDLLFIGSEDLRSYHLMERKAELRTLIEANSDQTVIRFQDHLDAAGNDVIDIACDMKLEGIVSKRLSEPYVSGRSGIWTKAKCRKEQHAIVGGWTVSDKGFAGLLLGIMQGKKLAPIGRVGTGFPRKLVDWLEPRLKQLETDASPFASKIPYKSGRKVHWAKPQLIAGIEHTSWTNDGVLRQAPRKPMQSIAANTCFARGRMLLPQLKYGIMVVSSGRSNERIYRSRDSPRKRTPRPELSSYPTVSMKFRPCRLLILLVC